MAATIPRFLLPQQSSIWRTRIASSSRAVQTVRNASHKAPSKAKAAPKVPVLEKPTKFNPPSHGAKLKKELPKHYGPTLSAAQKAAQQTKKYPNMMPAEGTFMYWFLNNRSIHIYITLGTLFSLAGYSTVTNFKRNSKFADMLPSASDLFFHPIAFVRTCVEVLRLHTAAVSAETAERRKQRVDDVQKRGEFRKAHGLETEGIGGWTAKTDEEALGPAIHTDDASPTADDASPTTALAMAGGEALDQEPQRAKKPLRKWLGIW